MADEAFPGTSETTNTVGSVDFRTIAAKEFTEGSRLQQEGNFDGAVEKLGMALETLAENVDPFAPETADYYYAYGEALLCSATRTVDVLGASMQKSASTVDCESDELVARAQTSDEDLQLAWELIETARVVYSKDDAEKHKLSIANCHSKVADILLEQDKFSEGLEELQSALGILSQALPSHDQLIIETLGKMALTSLYAQQTDLAGKYYIDLAHRISQRIHHLYSELTGIPLSGKAPVEDQIPEEELNNFLQQHPEKKEKVESIKSLQELHEDIQERISDLQNTSKAAEIAQQEAQEEQKTDHSKAFQSFSSTSSSSSSSAVVHDLGVKGSFLSSSSSSSSSACGKMEADANNANKSKSPGKRKMESTFIPSEGQPTEKKLATE